MLSKIAILIALFSIPLVSCNRGMVTVKINNESGNVINNIQIITEQETLNFKTLQNDFSETQTFKITGDSGLKIKFTPNQQSPQEQDLNIYLTRGYHGDIQITIKPDFKVSVKENLKTGL